MWGVRGGLPRWAVFGGCAVRSEAEGQMWLWDRLAQFQGVKLRAGWRDIKVLCRGSSWKLEQCVEGAVATEAVLAKPWSRVATGGAGSRHLPPAIPPPSEGRGPPKIRPCERGRRRGWRRGRETDRRRDRRRRAPRKLNGERRPPHRRDKTRPEGAPILRSLNGGKTRFYSTPVRSEFAPLRGTRSGGLKPFRKGERDRTPGGAHPGGRGCSEVEVEVCQGAVGHGSPALTRWKHLVGGGRPTFRCHGNQALKAEGF